MISQTGNTNPPEWSDFEALNAVGLTVYEQLLLANQECAALLRGKGQKSYLNIVSIFFPEFQKVLSRHFILAFEKSTELTIEGRVDARPTVKRLRGAARNLRMRLRRVLASRRLGPFAAATRPTAMYTSNLPLRLGKIGEALGEGVRLVPVPLADPKVAVPEREGQLDLLRSSVDHLVAEMTRSHGVTSSSADELVRTLEGIVALHTAEQAPTLDCQVLLVGSLLRLQTRLWAVLAKQAEIPVVSVAHGEQYGALDEPVFGYGEGTYTDVMVGYGDGGRNALTESKYLEGLLGEVPRFAASSASVVQRMYSSDPIPRLSDLTSPRVLYAPTALEGQGNRYGPFRDPNSLVYLDWQERLLRALTDKFGAPIGWKRHPKDRVTLGGPVPGVTTYQEVLFEDIMDDFDILVFDYFSSTFSMAAATNKPIIFLDLGLRNFSPRGIEATESRSLYVRADVRDAESSLEKALAMGGQTCANDFSPTFSLSGTQTREKTVADILRETLPRP